MATDFSIREERMEDLIKENQRGEYKIDESQNGNAKFQPITITKKEVNKQNKSLQNGILFHKK